jgi:hypothetical protein
MARTSYGLACVVTVLANTWRDAIGKLLPGKERCRARFGTRAAYTLLVIGNALGTLARELRPSR